MIASLRKYKTVIIWKSVLPLVWVSFQWLFFTQHHYLHGTAPYSRQYPLYRLTFYVLLLGKLIEHNISTGAYKKYYLFNGKLLALREGLGSGSTYRYLVTDHLGSLNTTLNLDGTVYSDLRYTPFGKERWAINTSPTGARFTAQRLDDLLDLYNYNARYYDPAIARFISADFIVPGSNKENSSLTVDFHQFGPQNSGNGPTNPQNLNRFTYVLNNPINFTDPTGHETYLEGDVTLEQAQQMLNGVGEAIDILEELMHKYSPVGLMESLQGLLAMLGGNLVDEICLTGLASFLTTKVMSDVMLEGIAGSVGSWVAGLTGHVATAATVTTLIPILITLVLIIAAGAVVSASFLYQSLAQATEQLEGIESDLDQIIDQPNINRVGIKVESASWGAQRFTFTAIDGNGGYIHTRTEILKWSPLEIAEFSASDALLTAWPSIMNSNSLN